MIIVLIGYFLVPFSFEISGIVAAVHQVAKQQSGIQLEQSWTATSLDASMNASKPVGNSGSVSSACSRTANDCSG